MPESEFILLRRFASNDDAEAFSEIIKQHASLVYGVCLRILEDKDKAADAVQETFLQLVRDATDITGSLPNWLHCVATHRSIDLVRSDSQRKQRELVYASNSVEVESEDNKAAWREISVLIDEELDKLDDLTREVIILHFFESQTMTEMAEKFGISQPTVSRRIESGIVSLRYKLKSRGVIVPAVILTAMLTENIVKAAPASVMKELGKIAIVGSKAATATGSGILASLAVKAKIIATATVITLLVGSAAIYYNSNQQIEAAGDVPQTEARHILQELQNRFQNRTPYQLSFLTEFELLGGTIARITVNQGEKPIMFYTAEGFIRCSGEKIESFYTDAHLNDDWQKGTEYHSVWQDGRAFELRKYESGREEAVTTRVKLHDMIRPDSTGWFADGVFIDSNHFSEDLLRGAELKIARENGVAGGELLRIEGEIPSGNLAVWLNIEQPVTLKRASFKASSNFMSQLNDVDAFNLEVEVLEYTKIGDTLFPSKAVATYTYEIPGNTEKLTKRLSMTRREIQVNPDFGSMNAFQIDFPEGIIVEDYEANVQYKWVRGKLQPTEYVSLIGKLLPELDGITIDLVTDQAKDKMILACFFDMNQRPSRNCIMQLTKKAEELKQKGVVVVGIQASRIDRDTLDEWIKGNSIPFSVGMITDDAEQIRFVWGVRALPWLILTDRNHVVIAEGFSIDELDQKIN